MPRVSGQKLKLFYLLDCLREYSDEDHAVSTKEIIDYLNERGISADRKTIYSDMSALQEYGYDIVSEAPRTGGGFKLLSGEFELAELKLLVDVVQSSKFITSSKSDELIRKFEKMRSRYESRDLNRQVFVANRIKSDNESIYYVVDAIHKAISENRKIAFEYMEWNLKKELVKREEGDRQVSPYALIWKDERYYLLAVDDKDGKIKHFRVDKIGHVESLEEPRQGKKLFDRIDLAQYADATFGMYGGKEETVQIQFSKSLLGVVLDRFGKDITIRKMDEDHIKIRVKLVVSSQFFGWLAGLGKDAVILEPLEVKERYLEHLKATLDANSK